MLFHSKTGAADFNIIQITERHVKVLLTALLVMIKVNFEMGDFREITM